jgi:hypothetical protein
LGGLLGKLAEPRASDHAAIKGVTRDTGDPLSSFTDVQWYCYQARQTVYFSAFSELAYDLEDVMDLARNLVTHAPQLTTGYAGARPGQPLDAETLGALVQLEKVDSLVGYPERWSPVAAPFSARPDLPLFRIRVAVLKEAADAKGRRACLQVLSTHALMEGVDSALLTRSQTSDHDDMPAPVTPYFKQALANVSAMLIAPVQLVLASIMAPHEVDYDQRMLVMDRGSIRKVAQALGVRQRSLMFALVAYTLNDGGAGFSKRALSCTYTDLDTANTQARTDPFFRFRLMEAKFKVRPDFTDFAKGVDAEMGRVEARDSSATQRQISALFGVHRRLKKWLPFVYSDRIFRFTGFYHMDLSLVPPHRLSGALAEGLIEPVFCGSYHEGMNVCVFAPGRKDVTLSFNMRREHLRQVDKILPLLGALEAELAA